MIPYMATVGILAWAGMGWDGMGWDGEELGPAGILGPCIEANIINHH